MPYLKDCFRTGFEAGLVKQCKIMSYRQGMGEIGIKYVCHATSHVCIVGCRGASQLGGPNSIIRTLVRRKLNTLLFLHFVWLLFYAKTAF